jgi:hypothetical protein
MSPGVKRERGPGLRRDADAERAAAFVIAKVRAASGRLFHQGPRVPPLATGSSSEAVRFIAEQRIHRLPTTVARALLAWSDGFPVELLTHVPPAAAVLALQAEGRRCVSLLPDGAETRPHDDALAFIVHDLCHLDKFIDAEHHRGQVGFFVCLHRAVVCGRWAEFESKFDPAFTCDWQHVAADMNGSAVFLFAALKMKLKMAVRRRVAAAEGRRPDQGGQLTPSEARAYGHFQENLLDLLRLRGVIAEAARRSSARRDDPVAACTLLRHFEEMGDEALRGAWAQPESLPGSTLRVADLHGVSNRDRAALDDV